MKRQQETRDSHIPSALMIPARNASLFGRYATYDCSAARITFWTATLFLVLLAVLHIIKPEYDPSWRMISEYEIGRFGWTMQLAFMSLAIASVCAIAAVWSQAKSIIGYIGFVMLFIAATGMIIGAIYPSDPITTDPDAL